MALDAPPLAGIKVLDLSAGIAGAVATMLLADFGASVIRVERAGGDPLRSNPGWPTWSRGKQSAIADSQDAADVAAIAALLAAADICVTSDVTGQAFAPAVLATLLGQARNPRLIVLRMPPYQGPGDAPWPAAASPPNC